MFKDVTFGAILAFVACTLVAYGAEKNIQEVLEKRYTDLASSTPEFGSLPFVANKEPVIEPASTGAPQTIREAATTQCECRQAPETPAANPEANKPTKKPKSDTTKACETSAAEDIVEDTVEEATSLKSCEKVTAAIVEEKQQSVQEQKVAEEEIVAEEPVGKKEKKEKSKKEKSKSKKRDKRDANGGKTKNKSKSKSKSKRSSEGKSKGKDKKSSK